MKGFTIAFTLFVVALTVSDVLGQEEHGHRSKRSPTPYDPSGLIAPLIVGKSFLLGSLLGPKIFNKGWGPVRSHGWGWAPRRSHGWGRSWSSPVVTVSHGWGW